MGKQDRSPKWKIDGIFRREMMRVSIFDHVKIIYFQCSDQHCYEKIIGIKFFNQHYGKNLNYPQNFQQKKRENGRQIKIMIRKIIKTRRKKSFLQPAIM